MTVITRLYLQLLGGVVGQGVHGLRRGAGGPDEVGVGLALGHVLGGGEAQDRHLRLRGVVADGEQLEGGERTDDEVDVVALDQLLRLGLGARGIAARVGDHQLGLAAGQRVVPVLEEPDHALLHLDATLGERPGLHGEQADAHGLGLGQSRHGQRRRQSRARTDEKSPTSESERHCFLLRLECPGAFAAPYPRTVEPPRPVQTTAIRLRILRVHSR